MKKTRVFITLCILAFCISAAAPARAGNFFVGGGLGTLGAGVDLGYQFSDWFKVRINSNYLPLDYSAKYNDIKYDAELRKFTAGLLLDLHPFSGKFRITAGAYYRDFNVDLTATPQYGLTIGDNFYSASQLGTVKGEVTWDKFVPYAGIGWGMGSGKGSKLSLDFNLGVMTLRGLDVKYRASGLDQLAGSPQYQALRQDLDREAEKIKDKIDDWKAYPVASLFLSFRF